MIFEKERIIFSTTKLFYHKIIKNATAMFYNHNFSWVVNWL
nr:MAG TPA: hypothetical protein [Bacteriophage sp.]